MNRGAVLNGFVIGNKAPIVSAIASMKISIGRLHLPPCKDVMGAPQLAERVEATRCPRVHPTSFTTRRSTVRAKVRNGCKADVSVVRELGSDDVVSDRYSGQLRSEPS